MGNRILKESIVTSDNLDLLTPFQETFFFRLLVIVDDYGRMDARPKLLSARLYPLKNIPEETVSDSLQVLEEANLIFLYQVNGRPYLQIVTWERHQTIRNKRSKYPDPEGLLFSGRPSAGREPALKQDQAANADSAAAHESVVNQSSGETPNGRIILTQPCAASVAKMTVPADAASVGMCPPTAYTGSAFHSAPLRENPRQRAEGFLGKIQGAFEEFWALYPKKQDRQSAVAAYVRLNPSEDLHKKMLETLKKYCASPEWQRECGRYIPYPAKWIVCRRWEDEVPEAAPEKQDHTRGLTREWTVSAQNYQQRDYSNVDREMLELFIRSNGGTVSGSDTAESAKAQSAS